MPAVPTPGPATPLWRAAQIFRLLGCRHALGSPIAIDDDLDRPVIGWALFAVLTRGVAAYLRRYGRRRAWVIAETVVVVALMPSTEIAVGLAVGMAAQTARRANAELQRAARLAASLQEREHLSREVHDGAVQVLALLARRAREIGCATNTMAEAAWRAGTSPQKVGR